MRWRSSAGREGRDTRATHVAGRARGRVQLWRGLDEGQGGGFPPDPPWHEAVPGKHLWSSTGTRQLIRPVPIEKQSAVGHLDQSSLASSDEIFPFLLRLERSFGEGANEDIDTFARVHREDLRRSQGRV